MFLLVHACSHLSEYLKFLICWHYEFKMTKTWITQLFNENLASNNCFLIWQQIQSTTRKNLLAGVPIYTAKLKWPRVHVSKFIEQMWEFQSTIIIHPPSFKELAQAPFSVFHLAVISLDCWLLGIIYVLHGSLFLSALDLIFSDCQFINFQWPPIFHLFAHAYNWRVFIVNCPKAEETP